MDGPYQGGGEWRFKPNLEHIKHNKTSFLPLIRKEHKQ